MPRQLTPSTANLHVIRQLKYRLKVIIQTERFRESSWKHCETAVLVEKNLVAFYLGLPQWELEGKVLLFSLQGENLTFYGRFRAKSMLSNLTHCFTLTFSQCHLVYLGVEIHL